MGVKLFSVATLSFCVVLIIMQAATSLAIAKPHCKDRCGKISIPYPFGMDRESCYMNKSYEIECNITSKGTHRAVIKSINMEVLNFSVNGTVTIKGPIYSSNCSGRNNGAPLNWTGTPFVFSDSNYLIGVGCNTRVSINDDRSQFSGCKTTCSGEKPNQVATGSDTSVPLQEYRCTGYNCCQASIYSFSQVFDPLLQPKDDDQGKDRCRLAFLAEKEWLYSSEFKDPYMVQQMEYVPLKLAWMMKFNILDYKYKSMNCHIKDYLTINFSHDVVDVIATECSCSYGYEQQEGNPYLGCLDIDECKAPEKHRLCQGITKCVNRPGWYKCAVDPKWIAVIVLGAVIGALTLVFGAWWLYKLVMKKRNIELRKKFFKRNGGLLLQQQLTSNDGTVQSTKIFTSKELEKATDHFNKNRILGQGGQGTVYKGMLLDGRIVAVKKSLLIDEEMLQEFINEVVILSQINHRNVVNLLGCCLETEVPLLVYEFIPNGSLFQLLHDQNDEVLLSWDMRLQIASESAWALAYLHSAAAIPIYHRDIKSTNILLDEKFRAKVSDFGTSRSITIEQTHLTTRVLGTIGYLDPEYFQSSQFTDKSDVYSFGVVLAELLSGQKPICSGKSDQETRSLATYFILLMEENKFLDIVDTRIMEVFHEKKIAAVADLTKQCLDLNGRKRPTMKEVATELEGIRAARSKIIIQQVSEETTKDTQPITICEAMPAQESCEVDNVEALSFDDELLIPTKNL